jgi:hypothetical protein
MSPCVLITRVGSSSSTTLERSHRRWAPLEFSPAPPTQPSITTTVPTYSVQPYCIILSPYLSVPFFSLSHTVLLCGAGSQDLLQDVLEAYLETDEINARKSTHQKTMTAELQAAGTCPR